MIAVAPPAAAEGIACGGALSAGGIQAVELDSDALEDSPWDDKAEVLGFEDMFVSDPEYDGDFDDVVVAVSRTTLPASLVADVAEDLDLAAAAI